MFCEQSIKSKNCKKIRDTLIPVYSFYKLYNLCTVDKKKNLKLYKENKKYVKFQIYISIFCGEFIQLQNSAGESLSQDPVMASQHF